MGTFNDISTKQSKTQLLGDSFPSLMVVTIISSIIIAIFIVGLAISRYYTRREKQVNDSSYNVAKYCRRQFTSTSCDNMIPISIKTNQQLHETINETTHIIKNSFSWPEVAMAHQHDQSSPTISSSSSTDLSPIEPTSLTFSLRWDDNIKSLFVRVLSARDLYIHKRHRQPLIIDSYVRIQLLNTPNSFPSMRTHIIKKNPHPIYDELFEYPHLEQITDENYSLIFTISTYDTFTRDEIIGEIIFPIQLTTLDSTEMTFTQNLTPRHKQLNNQELGQMLISVCYQPSDSSLAIIVLKASNLPQIGTTRLINPYFKIYMFYKQQRIVKKRSTIKRTTQTPVYNECFTFPIPDNDIENIHFDIILFDYDRHMKHEPIGIFSIGKELNQHWNDVCHRQVTKQIAHWYQLNPFNDGSLF